MDFEWIRPAIVAAIGFNPDRIILVGSRARGTARSDSDWDVLIVEQAARSTWPHGPIRRDNKLKAPDGNDLEFYRAPPADLIAPEETQCRFVREALQCGIDL